MARSLVIIAIAAIPTSAICFAQTRDSKLTQPPTVGPVVVAQRLLLDDQDRTILRTFLRSLSQSGSTTGSSSAGAIPLGEHLPDAVELHAFPGEVYRLAPRLVGYRFIRIGGRAYVVDPSDRTVIEEVN